MHSCINFVWFQNNKPHTFVQGCQFYILNFFFTGFLIYKFLILKLIKEKLFYSINAIFSLVDLTFEHFKNLKTPIE